MGWWSATVMGGDTPSDYLCDLQDAAHLNSSFFDRFGGGDEDDVDPKVMREAIIKNLDKVFDTAKRIDERDKDNEYSCGIAAQVFGVFLIENGVKMSKEMKEFVLAGIKADTWAKEDAERKAYMDAFYKQVKAFRGKRADVEHEGLFAKIEEHLAKGKSGLVNK